MGRGYRSGMGEGVVMGRCIGVVFFLVCSVGFRALNSCREERSH